MTESPSDKSAPTVVGLFDHTPDSLRDLLSGWKEPAFRVSQILRWAYVDGATEYDAMTNLSKSLREKLADRVPFYQSKIAGEQVSKDGTTKRLLAWGDGATSECVLIPGDGRRTACISSQVGCPVGCVFCASGLDGLVRQLTAGQIVEQAMRIRQLCGDDARLSNVVFMGLGEPLANYSATIQAVRTINAEWGLGIGARKITVSTVGLENQMRRLADEKLQITLALSLHAPTDELRRELIPWAARVSINALVEAAKYYFDTTGREVPLEYILIGRVKDATPDAHSLARISRSMRSNVNLIPYNPIDGLPYKRPTHHAVQDFLATLVADGVNAHVRVSRGLDIDSACGQLRRRGADRVEITVRPS